MSSRIGSATITVLDIKNVVFSGGSGVPSIVHRDRAMAARMAGIDRDCLALLDPIERPRPDNAKAFAWLEGNRTVINWPRNARPRLAHVDQSAGQMGGTHLNAKAVRSRIIRHGHDAQGSDIVNDSIRPRERRRRERY